MTSRRYDGAEPVRVNKWLAQAGVCSRREAEAMIAEGKVFIDGARVDDPGRKIAPGQMLEVRGDVAAGVTVVVHKPVGVVSAHPEPGQTEAAKLLTPVNWRGDGAAPDVAQMSLPPVGRLDRDSRGLLLLSSDGVLAKAVIGPASEIEKEYLVAVEGVVTARKIALLRHGLRLDGRDLRAAKVARLDDGRLRMALTEGRNRQIRRMCTLVDLEVVDLLRVRIGPLMLGSLPEGCWRTLTDRERGAFL
jgi:23S rRNA pseudouridine2604 synthase